MQAVRAAFVSCLGAALIVVGWSADTEANALVAAAMIVLYLAPLFVGATGWRAALMLPVWVFAGAVVANYGPAPTAWDVKAGIWVPTFTGALACAAASARTCVVILRQGRGVRPAQGRASSSRLC